MDLLVGKLFSGKAFKEECKIKFVKLTTFHKNHHGLLYKEGLNNDVEQFEFKTPCSVGGIYICPEECIIKWIEYGGKIMHFIWECEIPDDAQVYVESTDKIKCSAVSLSNPSPVCDLQVVREHLKAMFTYASEEAYYLLSSWFVDPSIHDFKAWLKSNSTVYMWQKYLTRLYSEDESIQKSKLMYQMTYEKYMI